MRDESHKIALAFKERRSAKAARTNTDGEAVYLHGNKIAWWGERGELSLTMAGWGTPTTRERLNTICEVMGYGRPFHQKKGEQYHSNTAITASNVVTYTPVTLIDPEEYFKK